MNPIEKKEGPCVILAGAGTGKTYTIVEKIKNLISSGIYKPERVVCITFSNEAANNLLLRIRKSLDLSPEKEPIIRTFHGFSADLLRAYGDKIGINNKFKILDPDQAKVILHRNLKINAGSCHRYIGTIGIAKDLGISLEDFESYIGNRLKEFENVDLEKRIENLSFELQTIHLRKDSKKKKDLVKEINRLKKVVDIKKFVNAWRAYEKLKKKGDYQDYSDLNVNTLKLLNENPDISENYDYLVVDEFQDTNKVQLDFIRAIARHGNVTVVGDLNQSIYRFRGAYRENINLFKKMFNISERDILTLDKSYRSPNTVLRVAHKLIENNYANKKECFFVDNVHGREGEKVEVYQMRDAKEEARKVVEIVKREVDSGKSYEDICVMFRTHQYGGVIKRALEREDIPYHAVAKASLMKQKSVKTAYDYLVILDKLKRKSKGGEQAWWDLVYQLDFKQKDLIKIGREIKNFVRSKEDRGAVSVYLLNNLDKFDLSGSGKLASKVLIEKIKSMLSYLNRPVSDLVKEVYRISGLINEQKNREEKEIMLNLNRFYEIAKSHEEFYDSDLSNFIYYLEILSSLGIDMEASTLEEKGVRLMTSHATKGLEYKIVIVTNLAQGRFPVERYVNNTLIPTSLLPEVKEEVKGLSEEEKDKFIISYEKDQQLLEERRLAYVSFTRAKEKLILTFAEKYGNRKRYPSMFLNEISYRNNPDINFVIDNGKEYVEPEIEMKSSAGFRGALGSKNFDELIVNITDDSNRDKEKKEHRRFSPSALLLFEKCRKEFEYKYVYNMPERKTISWEALRLGSLVHFVLEKGVSSGFSKVEEFLDFAMKLSMDNDWESVSYDEAKTLIRVFYERNKGRYNEKSKTEQYLPVKIAGLDFVGFADRIDFNSDGEVEIVDYKTGRRVLPPKERNWQLGFYALAAKEKYGSVRKIILDMLKQDKPLEFELDDKGNAVCLSSDRMSGFNIYEVEEELVKAAHAVIQSYEEGFDPCPIEKNCGFCNEYVYGL